MQNRNFTLFLVLSVAVFLGWSAFSNWMWPPRPKPAASQPDSKESPRALTAQEKQALLVSSLVLSSTSGLNTFADLGSNMGWTADALARTIPPPTPSEVWLAARKQSKSLTNLFDGSRNMVTSLLAAARAERVTPAVKVHLGDESFKLQAELTSKGAGVEHLTLNQFEAANKDGKPAEKDGKPEHLHLIPGTDGVPSYLLYHYANPDDKRPSQILGRINWKTLPVEKAPDGGWQRVAFQAELVDDNVRLTKTFTLNRGDYHVSLALKLERIRSDGSGLAKFKYQLTGAHGLPIEGQWYTYTYRNALVGWEDQKLQGWRELIDSRAISNLGGGEAQPKSDKMLIYGAVAVQYFASVVAVDDQQEKRDFLEAVRPTLEAAVMKGKIVGFGSDRFTLALSEKEQIEFKASEEVLHSDKFVPGKPVAVVYRLEGNDFLATELRNEDDTNPLLVDDVTVRLISEPLALASGALEHKYVLYNGPVKVMLLGQLTGDKAVDPALVERYEHTLHLNTLTDYHSPGIMGSISSTIGWNFLIVKFTNLMHWVLWNIHKLLPVWGLCIIVLTVIVRGIMCPLSRRQVNNQMAMQEKMAKLGPEVKKLEEKFKDDYQALNQAKTELYLRNGINPLSTMGGCLLMFAQMPIFLGLYYALQESIHFRLQPFLWIENLAAPDMLIWWSQSIPFISRPADQLSSFIYLGPYFNLLPILAVGLMIVQQKMMTPPPADEQQEMQQKMMKWMMVVFGFMFYKVAAGLCIYFIASSLWGLAERKIFPKPVPAGAGGTGGAGGPAPRSPRPDTGPNGRGPNDKNGSSEGFGQRMHDWWQKLLKDAGKQQQARKEETRPDEDRKKKKKRRK